MGPANASAQYNAVVGYESLLDSHIEPISIDVGLRERTLTTPRQGSSKTMMLNPINGQPLVDAFVVSCLSYQETMAEKLRAALTQIASVSSNEPVDDLGDGHTAPDWQVTGPLTLNLRAERSGGGSGRVYTVTLECLDDSANPTTGVVQVSVPHDRS